MSRNRSPRLTRYQKLRVRGLLEMPYTPQLLADAIGCHRDTIYRSFVPAGCPHARDERGRITIIGTELSAWYFDNLPTKVTLKPNEGWCFRCNRPTTMEPPLTIKPTNRHLELVTGTCSDCGGRVNRARARDNSESSP